MGSNSSSSSSLRDLRVEDLRPSEPNGLFIVSVSNSSSSSSLRDLRVEDLRPSEPNGLLSLYHKKRCLYRHLFKKFYLAGSCKNSATTRVSAGKRTGVPIAERLGSWSL